MFDVYEKIEQIKEWYIDEHFDLLDAGVDYIESELYKYTCLETETEEDEKVVDEAYIQGKFMSYAEQAYQEYIDACEEQQAYIAEREREYRDMVWGNQYRPNDR